MNEETKKTEDETAANNTANTTDPKTNPLCSLKGVYDLLNQPLIANALSTGILYWVIDPKGMKGTLGEIKAQMAEFIEVINQQTDEIANLKKQIKRQQLNEDESGEHAEDLRGYRKAKRKASAYLD